MCLMYLSWNKLKYDFNHRAFVFTIVCNQREPIIEINPHVSGHTT